MNALVQLLTEHRLALWTIAAGSLCSVSCALLGCYLVLRRMSLLGDAISHAVLPGIVIAFLLQGRASLPAFIAAVVVGMLTAYGTESLTALGRVPEDTSMGLIYTSLFALGVFLLTNLARNVDLDPGCVLYGAIELVPLDRQELWGLEIPRAVVSLGITAVATLAFVLLLWKELKIISFDPALAQALALRAGLVHYLLMGMIAWVTVASFEAVGSILVIAMLIVPPATAQLLTDRLDRMLVWSVIVGILSSILGYILAARLDTTVAGMMAVVAGCQFTLAALVAPRYGLLGQFIARFLLSLRIVSEDLAAMLYRAEELARRSTSAPLTWARCARALGGGPAAWLSALALRRRGKMQFGPGFSLQLTDAGRESARSLVRAHRLWEAFLVEYFGLPLDHLHAPAERVEHYIGPQLQDRLAAALEHADTDPHGRVIPSAGETPSPPAP